jgi:hypothetical protein
MLAAACWKEVLRAQKSGLCLRVISARYRSVIVNRRLSGY